jgi:hypothetical protein
MPKNAAPTIISSATAIIRRGVAMADMAIFRSTTTPSD